MVNWPNVRGKIVHFPNNLFNMVYNLFTMVYNLFNIVRYKKKNENDINK